MPDPRHAAEHFAYAVLGPYQDKALLRPDEPIDQREMDRRVEETVARFVRAYTDTADHHRPKSRPRRKPAVKAASSRVR